MSVVGPEVAGMVTLLGGCILLYLPNCGQDREQGPGLQTGVGGGGVSPASSPSFPRPQQRAVHSQLCQTLPSAGNHWPVTAAEFLPQAAQACPRHDYYFFCSGGCTGQGTEPL